MCEREPLDRDWLASFVYLGNRTSADGDPLVPVKHRIAQAAAAFTNGRTVFTNNNISTKLKIRLYKSGVTSVIRYGAETYTLTESATNALQLFNARHLSKITGREIASLY